MYFEVFLSLPFFLVKSLRTGITSLKVGRNLTVKPSGPGLGLLGRFYGDMSACVGATLLMNTRSPGRGHGGEAFPGPRMQRWDHLKLAAPGQYGRLLLLVGTDPCIRTPAPPHPPTPTQMLVTLLQGSIRCPCCYPA